MSGFTKETARLAGQKSSRKGVPNKTTSEIKEAIKILVVAEAENFGNLMKNLTEKERLDIWVKLLPYVVPKQTEITGDFSVSTQGLTVRFEDYTKKEDE